MSARCPAPRRPGAGRPAVPVPRGRCSRSSAGSTTGSRAIVRSSSAGISVEEASSSTASEASSSGSRSTPSTSTRRIQDRWLSPTCSRRTESASTPNRAASRRWNPIATLHRPSARWPSSSRARVMMPTGFVKSTIQASGSARSRTTSAMPSTIGTVRSALANPPGPVVSWPSRPNLFGSVSSTSRAAWPPTRSWISTADCAVHRLGQ